MSDEFKDLDAFLRSDGKPKVQQKPHAAIGGALIGNVDERAKNAIHSKSPTQFEYDQAVTQFVAAMLSSAPNYSVVNNKSIVAYARLLADEMFAARGEK